MKYLLSVLFFISLNFLCTAQDTFKLWKAGEKPYYKENTLKEYEKENWNTICVHNITDPEITVFRAKGKNTGKAVIILPGGGYRLVALYHEGFDVAKKLSEQGITACVLKYRLPLAEASDKPHLVPVVDVQKAFRLMREKSGEYGIDKNMIGVAGFSAGAHLAATTSILSNANPAFSILIYGKYNRTKNGNNSIKEKKKLENMTKDDFSKLNLIPLISEDNPPAFLVHSVNDPICPVEQTIQYAKKLIESKVPTELHLYPEGKHGYGLGKVSNGTDQWLNAAINWIKRLSNKTRY